jgi:hypothetical protein
MFQYLLSCEKPRLHRGLPFGEWAGLLSSKGIAVKTGDAPALLPIILSPRRKSSVKWD